jgi:hypothetical protein
MTKLQIGQIPPDVRELWGKPPLLSSEDPKAYEKLAQRIIKDVAPTDIIEWLWSKDIIDHYWEVRRLRRFKIMLIELEREEQLPPEDERGRVAGEEYYESERGEADLFLENLERWEQLDQLLTIAEVRRMAVLREIERRRELFAHRLRKVSDDIIDGEFQEHNPASEISGSGRR